MFKEQAFSLLNKTKKKGQCGEHQVKPHARSSNSNEKIKIVYGLIVEIENSENPEGTE